MRAADAFTWGFVTGVLVGSLLAAPATAGSLPQVPGVILDDTYAPVSKSKAPPPRPDLICWRNTERTEWRWAFTAPAPWWVPAPSGAGCDLAAPGNLNERRPGFATTPAPGPPQFRDLAPSDDSRCDGVWRPLAACR